MADVNFQSYADGDGGSLRDKTLRPADLRGYADTLKFSNYKNFVVENCTIYGCNENSVDLCRLCENITFINCTFIGGQQANVVIKGGCKNIKFVNCIFTVDHKAWCDILFDDWTYTSSHSSTATFTDCVTDTKKPLRVVYGRFSKPEFVRTPHTTNYLYVAGLHIYNYVYADLFKSK